MSALSPEQVAKIAELARLELTSEERDLLARQLADIVGYVEELREVPTDGVEPLAHPLPVSNVFREDEQRPSLPVDQALANAPRRKNSKGDGYYAVPAVLE